MLGWLLLFVGGGVGTTARHLIAKLGAKFFADFPAGTLTVNFLGCLLMGLLASLLPQARGVHPALATALTTGLLGGFTTYSTFSYEVLGMWRMGEPLTALLYALGTLTLALIGVFGGWTIGRAVTGA